MKLSFSFSRKQILEIALFATIVAIVLVSMSFIGADFR